MSLGPGGGASAGRRLSAIAADPIECKRLFEFLRSIKDQAQLVCLVTSVAVLGAADERILSESKRLVDMCFAGNGPLRVHCRQSHQSVLDLQAAIDADDRDAARGALRALHDNVAAAIERDHLHAFHEFCRQREAEEVAAVTIAPDAAEVEEVEIVVPVTLDEVMADPQAVAYLVLFLMGEQRHRALWLWSQLNALTIVHVENDADNAIAFVKAIRRELPRMRSLSQGVLGIDPQMCAQEQASKLRARFIQLDETLRVDVLPAFVQSSFYSDLIEAKRSGLVRSQISTLRSHPATADMIIHEGSFDVQKSFRGRALLEYVVVCQYCCDAESGDVKTDLVMQYPPADSPRTCLKLPGSISEFCFPIAPTSRPRLFNVVLTNSDNGRLYGACIQLPANDSSSSIQAVCVLSTYERLELLRSMLLPFRGMSSSELGEVSNLSFDKEPLATLAKHTAPVLAALAAESFDPVPDDPAAVCTILFRLLHPLRILELLELVLLEQKILILSTQLNILTTVGESLRTFLFPFSFNSVYIPVLPNSMIEALQCPTPFLIGMHTSMADCGLNLDTIDALSIVDLDNDRIWHIGKSQFRQAPPMLPQSIRSNLMVTLRKVCFGPCVDRDTTEFSPASVLPTPMSWRDELRDQLVNHLLFEIDSFVAALPSSDSNSQRFALVFDAPAFLLTKPREWTEFLCLFFATGCFAAFISSLFQDPSSVDYADEDDLSADT